MWPREEHLLDSHKALIQPEGQEKQIFLGCSPHTWCFPLTPANFLRDYEVTGVCGLGMQSAR